MALLRKHRLPLRSLLPSLSPLHFLSPALRLLSTQPNQAPPSPTSSDFALRYLVDSCGLTADRALRAAKRVPHLKSPERPDAVLRFLRQCGVSDAHIKTAALRDASFLTFNVDKCLKPRVAALQEIGFSPSQISLFLALSPQAFKYTKLQEKVQFWISIFGSVEKLLPALKLNLFLLSISDETTSANLSLLQEECGLSVPKIAYLITYIPGSISFSPQNLKIAVARAEELGVSRSSGMFIHALKVVCWLNPSTIDAKIHNLRELGFSQDEVKSLVSRFPIVLTYSEEMIRVKMEFLIKEAGCHISHVLQNPVLFSLSLEKRLIPRNLIRKLLVFRGHPVAHLKFATFMHPTEEQFVMKFILPYEDIIPGLHEAYKDVCAGSTKRIEWFKSISS